MSVHPGTQAAWDFPRKDRLAVWPSELSFRGERLTEFLSSSVSASQYFQKDHIKTVGKLRNLPSHCR